MPSLSYRLLVACVPLLVCASTALAADDELRTWTDSTGKFKIKAQLVKVENNTVTLLRENNEELEIDLKKLSDADQKFVADALKAAADSPFKTKSEDPFKSKPKPGAVGSSAAPPSQAGPRNVTVDWSSVEQVSLGGPGTWKVEVATAPQFASQPKTAPLPPKTGFFEKLAGLAVNRAANKAAVSFVLGEPKPTGVTRLVVCDLATGKTSKPVSAPGQMTPLAVHDDGKQIVMKRDEFGFGNQDRLEVWTINGSNVSKSVIWTPYDDAQHGARDVMWGEFINEATLATSSRNGRVTIWSYPEIRPLHAFTLVDGAVPALSPDRRLIAYCTGEEVGLFDVAKREVLAQQATPSKLQWPFMAFSPSGRRLACIAFDKVLAWDVASGTLERTIPCPGIHIHGAIEFPDENFVLGGLVGNRFLIDLENQLKLWTYQTHDQQVRSVAGWTFFGVANGDKNPGALLAMQVPHPAAKDLLKKALTSPDLFVLKAGTTVKLDLSGIPDDSQQKTVEQALTKRLQAIQCQVGPNGTIELAASIEGPKEKKVEFRHSGDYTIQEYRSRLRFVYQGQTAWESSTTNVPFGFIMLKEGENVGTYLQQREKPDYAFFGRVELPKFLQKPTTGQGAGGSLTLGQSKVTTTGIK